MGTKIRCKDCNDIIESKNRHDFKTCKCGKIFVDGGNDYLRVGWPEGNPDDYYDIVRENESAITIS